VKGDGGDGDSWSYKMCKAPVRMSAPTMIMVRLSVSNW